MENKDSIRKRIKMQRQEMSPDDVCGMSKKISDGFFSLDCLAEAKNILVYADFANEVSTGFVVSKLLYMQKNVFLPRVMGDDIVALPFDPANLEKGKFGITEPKYDEAFVLPAGRIDIAVVPGIAFDRKGGRIGFGKGYYDRFLAGSDCRKIAFAYDFQMVDDAFSEIHDVMMDCIITEKGILEIEK